MVYSVPTQSDSNNRQSYYQKMKSSLADKKSECDNCVSVMKDLHDAAHKLSPGDISWILIQLCKDKSFFNNGDDCEKEYDGAGLYMAKALYYLDEDTHDMSAVCKFNYKIKDCAAPPVVQIKESEWFKSAKSDQQKVEPKPDSSGMEHDVMYLLYADRINRQDVWRSTHVRCSFGSKVSIEPLPQGTQTTLTF